MVLKTALHRGLLVAGIGISLAGFGSEQSAEASIRNRLRGTVSVMGNPVANASVTLWTTKGGHEPEQVMVVRSKQEWPKWLLLYAERRVDGISLAV